MKNLLFKLRAFLIIILCLAMSLLVVACTPDDGGDGDGDGGSGGSGGGSGGTPSGPALSIVGTWAEVGVMGDKQSQISFFCRQ